MPLLRQAVPAALAAWALCAAPAAAESLRLHPRTLAAHTPAGGVPNAPAADPTISGDGCPAGGVAQLTGSRHGNYAVCACSSGQAFMSYVGGR